MNILAVTPAVWRTWLVFAALAIFGVSPAQAIIDLAGDGYSDIWQSLFNAQGLPTNADGDGDGQSNWAESVAGADPFDANSRLAVATITESSGSVLITFASGRGKKYQVEGAAELGGSWTPQGPFAMGTGSELQIAVPAGSSQFFRVVVTDLDSDGDGLSDWEEAQLGLNPHLANSDGGSVSDYDKIAAALAAKNVVSIRATDTFASEEGSKPGTFTVTRSGNINALTVTYSVSGTATPGVDYVPLTGSVKIPFGANTATISVAPLPDAVVESGETVALTLTATDGTYILATNLIGTATVVINDPVAPSGTGLTAQYFDNASATYANAVNFTGLKVTRTDPVIDMSWGSGSPYTEVNRDSFSARWDGDLAPSVTGNYVFDLQADDGARLYVDNVLVIDGWTAGSSTAVPLVSGPVALTGGTRVPIRVEYYENTDNAFVHLRWKPAGATTFVSMPTANVFRPGNATTNNWSASYFNNTTLTGASVRGATYETAVYYDWRIGVPDPSIGLDTFSARWTGQIQPQYSEEYTFVARTDDGVKLWVNNQLIVNAWATQNASDRPGKITLQGGVRYDIKMEYFDNTSNAEAHLSWYSASQPKEIVPAARLYPSSASLGASAVTSPTDASALVNGPFSFRVTASNSPVSLTVSGLPPGLSYDPATGLITGTPTVAGDFQITITATNSAGTGTSVLNLHIADTGGMVTRELWTGVPGTKISDVPIDTPVDETSTLATLEANTDEGDDYAARIRGYITAPVTGNYYFWVAGNNAAELWISNDSEPVNKVKRASVLNGTAPEEWTKETNQKSPWLALTAGQKYYVEVLHKAGSGNDNLAVGWVIPGQQTATPVVVPRYVLSPYVEPAAATNPGTLYAATMLAQGIAQTKGYGTSTLRLSADETYAIMTRSYSGLTGPLTGEHIHSDPYGSHPSQIIFDIDDTIPQADGSYRWDIEPVGTFSAAEIVDVIKQGAAYINLHTAAYPGGEIRGNFVLAAGSRKFVPPAGVLPPADDHGDPNAAARFLTQATFGPSQADVAALQAMPSFDAWIEDQFGRQIGAHLPVVYSNVTADPSNPFPGSVTFNAWWQRSVSAPDQLRQRVAFALSEIMVVSEATVLANNARALSYFYDTLLNNAFGNARDLLKSVTLTPSMGRYLDMLANDKPDLVSGRHPNENYAREIMQLFSIGLYRMWPDGTFVLTSKDELVPTYDQNTIIGMAQVFTGWTYNQPNAGAYLPTSFSPAQDWVNPMKEVPGRHFTGTKRILDNVVLPGLPTVAGLTLDPYATHTTAQIQDPNYQALPSQELTAAHDALFNHPNIGPFLCRQLIQRFVTSNPTPGYVYRVVQKFNDNGSGVRGDMKGVIKAILLDYEARSPAVINQPGYGKQREPLLRVTGAARAFPPPAPLNGTYDQNGSRTIVVTTPAAHRLANGNTIFLQFTSGLPAPTNGSYGVAVTGANAFTINATGLLNGTYSQTANLLTVTANGHGLAVGNRVYLKFTTGGGIDGQFQVDTVPNSNTFTILAGDSASRSGNVLLAFYKAGYAQSGTTITVSTPGNHQLSAGDFVYIDFMAGSAVDGTYQVASIVDEDHFTVTAAISVNQTQNSTSAVVAPANPPPLVRSGAVSVQSSTWNMGNTDTDLAQTPLRAPTVFNFFFPDFRCPGALASAGLTTPEFQLTSDTNIMRQTNLLSAGVLNPSSNTGGFASFKSGSSALVMDLAPWMPKTSDAQIPALVDELGSLLTGGQVSSAMKTIIVNYITGPPTGTKNFPMSATPTDTQKRDRVRGIVQLLVTSPDYSIQR